MGGKRADVVGWVGVFNKKNRKNAMRIDDVINIVESEKKVIEYKVRASNSVLKQMILSHEHDLCDRIIRKINEYYIHSKDIKINTIQNETVSKS